MDKLSDSNKVISILLHSLKSYIVPPDNLHLAMLAVLSYISETVELLDSLKLESVDKVKAFSCRSILNSKEATVELSGSPYIDMIPIIATFTKHST
jgi:hypothetical protein